MILSHAPPCSCKSKEKEKEKKRNINNDLAILPSHDTFPIIQKVGKLAYELKIPSTWKSIHPVVNESYLTSYVTPIFKQQSQRSDNRVANPID